ncbi:MAG: hypothetical protein IPN29_02895 [Saprospiraceae bacterium]|nr:hypothetical protein [Saprospiraceae bacterium]
MSRYFQQIRSLLTAEGRLSRYLVYAIGEIVLVMIRILMALQVNNWNLDRQDKKRETKFLNNIVLDLNKDLARLAYLVDFRKGQIAGDQQLIAFINGQPVTDISKVTYDVVNSLMEERFTPNNNTYRELSSSGNLNLISNDSIKLLLLELEELYKTNNFSIDHEAFDYREYISKPLNKHVDLD